MYRRQNRYLFGRRYAIRNDKPVNFRLTATVPLRLRLSSFSQLRSVPVKINPGIPIGLEQITMKAMEKMPADRYTSAAEMLSDIERLRLNPSHSIRLRKIVC